MTVNKLVSVLDPSGLLPALVEAEIIRLIHAQTIAGANVLLTVEADDGQGGTETVQVTGDEFLQAYASFVDHMTSELSALDASKADLDPVTGKLRADLAPDISISDFKGEVASQAAMLAVVGQNGDYVIRTDTNTMWTVVREPSNVLANWVQWRTPASPVQSVAGKTGAVTLLAADITNSTATGRSVMTATNAAAGRAAIGAGTSSLVIGTASTQAMRGDKNRVVTSLPSSPDPDLIYFVPEV